MKWLCVFIGLLFTCTACGPKAVHKDCEDQDNDGYGTGAGCLGEDCDDADPLCYEGACCTPPSCTDGDGDGYGVGTGCLGPDCDDADPQCFSGACCTPPSCTDDDGDGYGEGAGCLGADCDDTDPLCFSGACCTAPLCPDPGCLSDTTVVAQGDKPALDVDSAGSPRVVYEGGGIWYTARDETTGLFFAPVQLADSGNDARIFVDEDDNNHVVWSTGTGAGSSAGWYTNNVGGSWKAPLRVCTEAQGGGDRVMLGRVLKVGSEEKAVAVWSVGSDSVVLIRIGDLVAAIPTVEQRTTLDQIWVPDLILSADGSHVKTVSRVIGGGRVKEFNLNFVQQDSYVTATGGTSGESASGFRTSDGVGHYTGAPLGEDMTKASPDHVWYNNDSRIASGLPAIVGDLVSAGDGDVVWEEVCVDSTGRGYVIHDSGLVNGLFVSYVDADQLVLGTVDASYDGVTALTARYGPMCAPTADTGVHVVYTVGDDILHRTIGMYYQ